MGKHSNLIFCQEDNTILDSIKHISANMSSVREVLPGRTWFIPHTQDKKDPLTITEEEFFDFVCTKPMAAAKAIYTSLTGFSPLMAEEVCCRAGIDGGFAVNALEENAKLHLFRTFSYLIEDIKNGAFTPNIVYQGDEPKEFSALKLTQYQDLREETYDSISGVLETYYANEKPHHPHPSEIFRSAPCRQYRTRTECQKIRPAAETVKRHRQSGKNTGFTVSF